MNLYVLLLGNAIAIFAVERTMNVFFEKRRTSFPIIALSYISVWVGLGLQIWLRNVALSFGAFILPIVIVTLNYDSTKTRRLAAVIGSFLMMQLSTGIIQTLLLLVPVHLHGYIIDATFIFATIIVYFMALVMYKRFKNIKMPAQNLHKMLIPFLFVPVTQLFIAIFIDTNALVATLIQSTSNAFGITFLFFYLYYSVSKSYEKDIKSALHSQEKEYYFTQCQLMQESVDKMKLYRHDIKLHLATLKDFTMSNKADEATNYLNSLIGSLGKSEAYSDTGNIAFDSIINFKLRDVLDDHINLKIKIFVPPELNIEVADVVTILGNLLDNAFDAVARVEDKMINLTVEANKGNLFIKVDNTFDGVVQYADNATEEKTHIVSRKGGDEHGHGLKNIQKSVEKYDGHMDITHADNIFSVGILLYVDEL